MPMNSNSSSGCRNCKVAFEETPGFLPPCKPSQIHINPLMCASRSIYVNKAFTSSLCPQTQATQKPERVYYNPKFFKNNTQFSLKSQEPKKDPIIYVNPIFLKNEISKNTELVLNPKCFSPTFPVMKNPCGNSGIHVNPMFLKSLPPDIKVDSIKASTITSSFSERLDPSVSSLVCTPRSKFVSKYKIVRRKSSPTLINNFYVKKIKNSLYKKINQLSDRNKEIKIAKRKFLKYISPNLLNQKKPNLHNLSEFKTIGLNKIVRKSVLQKQIESRMQVRKISKTSLTTSVQKVPSPRKSNDKVSKYKIVRTRCESTNKKLLITNKNVNIKRKVTRRKKNSLVYSSFKYRADKQKTIATFIKKLRKNNQPCPFYNRYGHCKGKDKGTCQKLHDSKYITICKRFVKGECKDDKCTLSHDVRPEKMPTCHHYLAGLCQRTDCPYLHIKVNPKAPICRSFLLGFCADVFNCTKRHEYLCPVFAEKGSCPRQKFCPYPHRNQAAITSKLLAADEFPLLNRKHKSRKPVEVSTINQTDTSGTPPQESDHLSPPAMESKTKEFKRYFLEPLSDS